MANRHTGTVVICNRHNCGVNPNSAIIGIRTDSRVGNRAGVISFGNGILYRRYNNDLRIIPICGSEGELRNWLNLTAGIKLYRNFRCRLGLQGDLITLTGTPFRRAEAGLANRHTGTVVICNRHNCGVNPNSAIIGIRTDSRVGNCAGVISFCNGILYRRYNNDLRIIPICGSEGELRNWLNLTAGIKLYRNFRCRLGLQGDLITLTGTPFRRAEAGLANRHTGTVVICNRHNCGVNPNSAIIGIRTDSRVGNCAGVISFCNGILYRRYNNDLRIIPICGSEGELRNWLNLTAGVKLYRNFRCRLGLQGDLITLTGTPFRRTGDCAADNHTGCVIVGNTQNTRTRNIVCRRSCYRHRLQTIHNRIVNRTHRESDRRRTIRNRYR